MSVDGRKKLKVILNYVYLFKQNDYANFSVPVILSYNYVVGYYYYNAMKILMLVKWIEANTNTLCLKIVNMIRS